MIYRGLNLSDYEGLIALWQSTEGVKLRDADSKEGIEKYLKRNPGLSFVVLDSDRLVGSIMAGHDGKRGYIQHLAVDQAYRRRGLASELVRLCLAALKEEGIVKSHIHVLTNNVFGQAFWAKQGWHLRDDIAVFSFVNGSARNA